MNLCSLTVCFFYSTMSPYIYIYKLLVFSQCDEKAMLSTYLMKLLNIDTEFLYFLFLRQPLLLLLQQWLAENKHNSM